MLSNKLPWIAFGPGRQQDVIDTHTVLFAANVEVVGVDQEVGKIEEFRNEFTYVGHVVLAGAEPGLGDAVEHTVCEVKVSSL